MLEPFAASQSSSEDLIESEISICTPPRHRSLEERLVDAPAGELEELLEKVLEKRPELRAKFAISKPAPKPKPVLETVEWDAELTGIYYW